MKAEQVYNENIALIRKMVDDVRKGTYSGSQLIPDISSNTKLSIYGLPSGYATAGSQFNNILDRIKDIHREVNCHHTECRAMPESVRDIRMRCYQLDKKEEENFCKCTRPGRRDINSRLSSITEELGNIYQTYKPETRQEKRDFDNILEGVNRKLTGLETAYNRFKEKEGCKSPNKLESELLVQGKKLTIIR